MEYAIGNRMKLFREAKGISQKIMAELLSITPQKLASFEQNRTAIPPELVKRFAIVVNTTVYNLVGPYSNTEIDPYDTDCLLAGSCICGYYFQGHLNNDLDKEHLEQHELFLRFSRYFGFQALSDNEVHSRFRLAIDTESELPLPERFAAIEEHLKWHYLKSARRASEDNWTKHPVFNDFVAMRLHQEKPDDYRNLPFGLYQKLVDKYGSKSGLPEGAYYFKVC